MSNTKKISIWIVAGLANSIYFYLKHYFEMALETEVPWIYFILGVMAVEVLSLAETGIVIRLFYRKRFSEHEKAAFDKKFQRQIILLLLYYISAVFFSLWVTGEGMLLYDVILPIALSGFMIEIGNVQKEYCESKNEEKKSI